MSVASRAILWNFFENQWPKSHFFRQPFSKQLYILNCLSQVLSSFPDNNGSRGIFVSPEVQLIVSVLFIFAIFSSLFF